MSPRGRILFGVTVYPILTKEEPMATRTLPDPQTCAFPGETPTLAVDVEADLQGRVESCDAALANALWQLARFYQAVGRPADATACVDRLLAGARTPAAQATGCLRAGQLLEQQDRYAEAEAMYARRLALRAAAVDVAYFLHNNRGYCLNLLGRYADAEAHTRAVVALDPERHNAHKNLGLALTGQGRLWEAARSLLEVDRRCPPDTRARGHLTELLTEHPEILEADPALTAACRDRRIRPGRVGSA
jgi:tetratricopeptide (TPR) repeat protein